MNQEENRPTMLNAEQVAQRLNMSKGFAYKIIQEMNEEQIKKDVYKRQSLHLGFRLPTDLRSARNKATIGIL